MEEQYSPFIFSEWLRHRRKALDLTQGELARRAGCSVSALRKIETGERRPSKQLAGLLAKALDIPEEYEQTFTRVARGEMNIERLQQFPLESLASFSDISNLQLTQRDAALIPRSKPTSPASRIPLQATPLIGRDAELAAMGKLFNDSQCRLLTLTGLGGIGKTRLAVEFASRQLEAFPGGVFYIPLTPVNSAEAIVTAIADALGFVFSGPNDPKEQLLNYVASSFKQGSLLVLDNLEHLLLDPSTEDSESGLIGLVSEFLQRSPYIKILGTSRERLNMRGEWTYELHGLPVPPIEFAGQLEDYNAVVLFVQSAQRARVDFKITFDDQSALAQICRLVEGIPLAIELAAAWVGVLSCQEIAQEIQSNKDFLSTSMRDIPERHRSIRATFDHSWKLLTDEERRAFCRLSVFHGGFDRYAAEQIAGASLPILSSLGAKSLVRRTESGRFDLHELIRQYTSAHLNSEQQYTDTYEFHSEYYLNFAHDREKSLKNASQQEAIRELTDEIDNVRAAWTWAFNHEKYAQLEQVARSLGWYYEITGLYREGIEQLEPLMLALKAMSQENKWSRLLALTLIHLALLYFRSGEFDRARMLYEESIAILRPIGDQVLLADSHVFLGIILHLIGEYERSRSILEEGLVCAKAGNNQWFEAYAVYNLGYIDYLMGHCEEALGQMMTGLEIWRTLGDPHSIALGLNYLVPALNKLGRYEEAKTLALESIDMCERAKNRWGMGTAYRVLGLATMAAGQFSEAQIHFRKSLEIFGEYIIGWDIARSLTFLADATLLSGDLTEAKNLYLDGLRLSKDAKAIPIALDALLGLGIIKAQAGKVEQALVLCYYIMNHSSSEQEAKSRSAQLCSELEMKLDPKQIDAARSCAMATTFEQIANDVLGTI
jgi:predicted ATPase/transcriptional regulator with XRE-family HTH domain